MTRRPVKSKKPVRTKAKVTTKPLRKAAAKATPNPSLKRQVSLDEMIAAGARALDFTVDKAWLPAVRAHLEVTLRLGSLVAAFALPDDAEPAPVFKA